MNKSEVRVQSRETVFNNYINVEKAIVTFPTPDGSDSPPVERYTVHRGDAVAAVIYDPEREEVVLVEQFRYAPFTRTGAAHTLEIVAGMVNPGEAPFVAMCREIEEETGYTPVCLYRVLNIFPSPGISSERIHIYYAEVDDRFSVGQAGRRDENEYTTVKRFSVHDIDVLIEYGDITDAKTIIGLTYVLDRELGRRGYTH